MRKVKNLSGVGATVLPAKVMVLLSKYSQAVKEHERVVIQLSSLNVFKHVHSSFMRSTNPEVRVCYYRLLREVNIHLAAGNMVRIGEIATTKVAESPEFDERYQTSNLWKQTNSEYSVTDQRI